MITNLTIIITHVVLVCDTKMVGALIKGNSDLQMIDTISTYRCMHILKNRFSHASKIARRDLRPTQFWEHHNWVLHIANRDQPLLLEEILLEIPSEFQASVDGYSEIASELRVCHNLIIPPPPAPDSKNMFEKVIWKPMEEHSLLRSKAMFDYEKYIWKCVNEIVMNTSRLIFRPDLSGQNPKMFEVTMCKRQNRVTNEK